MKGVRDQRARARNERVSNTRQRRQQHLLDVKVRAQTAVQHRNKRLMVVASKGVLTVLTCAGLVAGVRYGAQRLFFDNPDYRLSRIEVQTDGTLQREQILRAAELREGVNIFSVNLGRVHERLQALPQVDEAQVVREMPSEIKIRIVERKPIAWIASDKEVPDPFAEEAFLVDARGVLMKEKKLLPEYLGLPVIVGCANESLEPGKVIDSFEAKTALELLRLSARSFMQTRFQIREIDASKGYCLVVTDKNRTRVTFGFDNLESQLQRLEQFLVWSDDSKREIATVNLLVQRNVPVTFAPTAVEIINDTYDPDNDGILRAMPANPNTKLDAAPAPMKSNSATDTKIRKAVPVQKGKRNAKNG